MKPLEKEIINSISKVIDNIEEKIINCSILSEEQVNNIKSKVNQLEESLKKRMDKNN